MRSLATLTLLLASLVAQAAPEAPLEYDPQLDAQQRTFVRLYVRTRHCLGDAARAMLRQGEREPSVVQHFMVSMCGEPLVIQLRSEGMAEEIARRTLVDMSKQALYEDVLHQPIPH